MCPIISRRERDAAEAAEEARRKAEVAAKKQALQAALSVQLAEHAASKQQACAAKREELAAIKESIQACHLSRLASVLQMSIDEAGVRAHHARCMPPSMPRYNASIPPPPVLCKRAIIIQRSCW